MSGAIATELDGVLRTYSDNRDIVEQLRTRDPLAEKMSYKAGGAKPICTIETSLAPGRSATAATADANAAIAADVGFALTYGDDFAGLLLNDKDILATRGAGSEYSLVDHVRREAERAERTMMNSFCETLYKDGTGVLGVRASAASATITLATASDARRFYKGQRIVFAASATGSLLDSGDYLTVLSTNPQLGTVTFSTNVSNISGHADGDYMFAQGDAANGSTVKLFKGWAAWIASATAVAAEGSFYGQTRANFPLNMVAGTVSDQSATGNSTYDKLFDGLVEIWSGSNGQSRARLAIMGASNRLQLQKELQSLNIPWDRDKTTAGHSRIYAAFDNMDCEIVTSTYVASNECLVIDPEGAKILHLGSKLMDYAKPDGGPMWERDKDNYKAFMRTYASLSVTAPSFHGRVIF